MNINKKILSLGLVTTAFIANSYLFSMQKDEDKIISNASYCIFEGDNPKDIIGGIPGSSKTVTFYTFNGDKIKTIEHNFHFPLMRGKLDPKAPKPQPVSCMLRFWPAIELDFGMTKGVPGWFIIFYDKNGNRIESYRYYYDIQKNVISVMDKDYLFDKSNPQLIAEDFPLDLSKIREVKINMDEYKKIMQEQEQEQKRNKPWCTVS